MQYLWVLSLSGVAAAIWMLVGVFIVGRMLPNYSHMRNTMSELGAVGQPTEKIHPFINNYPIGTLFLLFGIFLFASPQSIESMRTIGVLICIHGCCHFLTGYFPCDADPLIAKIPPSTSHKIHALAGLTMQITLLAATLLLFFSGAIMPSWLRWFSLACAILSTIFFLLIFTKKALMGLYQRLSFGGLLLWAAVLSWFFYSNSW